MLTGNYLALYDRLRAVLPEKRLMHDPLHTLVYGTDASFYRLTPKLVVIVESETEVEAVLSRSSALGLPVTFRAAGTSLSGQSISDSVLVVLGPTWTRCTISPDVSRISLQPGVIGKDANAYLAPYAKKIGPDPASINAATIGGIAANNASGMCCGTAQNSYRTLSGMKVIFHDGAVLDTTDRESQEVFLREKKDLVATVTELRDTVVGKPELADRIRRKYKMKNTTGYSLNAFVDFTDPLEIIQHLLIGSEGTLGFIANITYTTVPDLADKASALIMFPDIATACRAIAILKGCTVEAAELMDRAALRSVEDKSGMPVYLKGLGDQVAALLVETRAVNGELLTRQIDEITRALAPLPKAMPLEFTSIPAEYTRLWNIRKGLFPSVGAMRATGTTCIIEDVAFPIPRLAEATLELQALFQKYDYNDAIIFGHALEGNLHFVFNQDFNQQHEVNRYARFIHEVTQMVVKKYDGSLKAEHGTGRNMAPFVELEWGADAYRIMREIKKAFDPENLLNPGVIINADPQGHLKDLKPLPAAHTSIDKCIECGFCEVHCPSRNLTLTPRHRIVAYREMARLQQTGGDEKRRAALKDRYEYAGNQTCATDGLCALACPVEIDTGKLIKDLRFQGTSPLAHLVAQAVAKNFGSVTGVMRVGLSVVDLAHRALGQRFMEKASHTLRRLTFGRMPLWNRYMPAGGKRIKMEKEREEDPRPVVVYFPSCITRTMGVSHEYRGAQCLTETTSRLLTKAGYRVVYPRSLSSLCCGMAFDSKGFKEQGQMKAEELQRELLRASNEGNYPVYVDMSPCLYRMKEVLDSKLQLYEPIEFALKFLVHRLDIRKTREVVAIHTTCSSTKMGLHESFKTLAETCAEQVVIPEGVECCGWAGDRGFTFPELTASALARLRGGLPDNCRRGYSTSRTCEIGLSLHSGISYKSIVYLLDECSSPKES
jgi:D-lactate dehydrogenase